MVLFHSISQKNRFFSDRSNLNLSFSLNYYSDCLMTKNEWLNSKLIFLDFFKKTEFFKKCLIVLSLISSRFEMSHRESIFLIYHLLFARALPFLQGVICEQLLLQPPCWLLGSYVGK